MNQVEWIIIHTVPVRGSDSDELGHSDHGSIRVGETKLRLPKIAITTSFILYLPLPKSGLVPVAMALDVTGTIPDTREPLVPSVMSLIP